MSEDVEKYKIGNEQYVCVAPIPCVRDEYGDIDDQSVKALFGKINEELDELKQSVLSAQDWNYSPIVDNAESRRYIAEEAADTITAITTLLEALGINAEMRNEAQRRVNEKNRERGRL